VQAIESQTTAIIATLQYVLTLRTYCRKDANAHHHYSALNSGALRSCRNIVGLHCRFSIPFRNAPGHLQQRSFDHWNSDTNGTPERRIERPTVNLNPNS